MLSDNIESLYKPYVEGAIDFEEILNQDKEEALAILTDYFGEYEWQFNPMEDESPQQAQGLSEAMKHFSKNNPNLLFHPTSLNTKVADNITNVPEQEIISALLETDILDKLDYIKQTLAYKYQNANEEAIAGQLLKTIRHLSKSTIELKP